MWIIPSRSRPHNIARLISAWHDTEATTPAVICLDQDDPTLEAYTCLSPPEDWHVEIGARKWLSSWYNWAYECWPDLKWYGVLADDVLPETLKWDRLLIEAAGSNNLAFGDDGKHGGKRATHFALGGDLVRHAGWLAFPGLRRLYIDTIWNEIAVAAGSRVYLPDVKLTHMHPGAGRAPFDSIYRKSGKDLDRQVYELWRRTHGV